MEYNYIQLETLVGKYNETDLQEFLNTFVCSKNSDVEEFIKKKSISFEKGNKCKTYLVHYGDTLDKDNWIGYFSLSLQSIEISKTICSNTYKKKLSRFNNNNNGDIIKVDGVLIAQLGKHDINSVGHEEVGKMMLQKAEAFTHNIFRIAGGKIGFLECENNEKLIQFYENNGYIAVGINDSVNSSNMQVFTKLYSTKCGLKNK